MRPPEIPRYKFFKATGPLTGTFTERQQAVHLYYRRANWHKLKMVTRFLKTRQVIPAYDKVEGLTVDQFPAAIVLRAFQLVETDDQAVWYQVNADRWIKATPATITVLDHDPYDHQTVTDRPHWQADMTVLPLHQQPATVDYVPGRQLTVYDQIYGQPVATVPDGVTVTLINQINDANGVRWYETSDHNFINGAYLHLATNDQA